ncbi:hypothetical protein [Methylobacterium oryzae]|uniref:hypothetical protein n=2 Tax=Methylobacterium TaxID=407 RepID=UPI001F35D45B|nr:hypothetical protein [Methylobacterium oryzae]UIN38197.1 hypothetical protein LXM90_29190 [Methylobacterium oryzae]
MPRLAITGTEQRYNTVAAVEDGGRWRMILPFPQDSIRAAALVGAAGLVCLSDDGELCLIDWRAGRDRVRRRLPGEGPFNHKLFVTRDADRIAVYRSHGPKNDEQYFDDIVVLRASDLEILQHGRGLVWHADGPVGSLSPEEAYPPRPDGPAILTIHGDLFEDPGGRLAFIGFRCGPGGSAYGLCRLERAGATLRYDPLPDAVKPYWFSPSGRYAVTPHSDPARGGVPEAAADTGDAGPPRLGQAVELWTTGPVARAATLVARPGSEPPHAITEVAWEPDERAFWIKSGYFWDRTTDFQRIGLDGTRSPVFSFARYDGAKAVSAFADVADAERVEIRFFSDSVYIPRARCADAAPARTITPEEDGYRSRPSAGPSASAVRRFLARSQPVVTVAAFSAAAIAEALDALTGRIRADLGGLLRGDVLALTFEVGGRAMTESAFFARIARERVAVVPALRALLTTYLAVQPGVVEARKLYRQLWGPEDDQGALAPAMQALLHLDPTAHDVFRDYLAQRDGEHEVYSTDVMMRTYIAEAGWRDRAMIRFGVYFALIRYRDGLITLSGGFLEEYGVLDAAESLLEPADFAALILEELDGFAARPDLDCRLGRDDLYRELRASLATTAYGRTVLPALAARSAAPSRLA